jgi:hypothetical protein
LPLAGGLAGGAAAAVVLSGAPGTTGWLGPGVVGLFSVLVVGRFFANLTTVHALVLLFAPLLAWLPELPGFHRLQLSLRGFVRVVLIAAAVMAVAGRAQQKSSGTTATSSAEDSLIQDYSNFKP